MFKMYLYIRFIKCVQIHLILGVIKAYYKCIKKLDFQNNYSKKNGGIL